MTTDEIYMQRCLQLASLASGYVAPNPMVGAVLVYDDKMIGEGYHQQYGKAHAEVNCIASVQPQHQSLISKATLYVSLEPCAHFGKTPPCADLIIEKQIPKVVVGCRDPFVQVNGKGIDKVKAAGIEIQSGVLEEACKQLNKAFFTFHTEHRPYIILKWAQTQDSKIASSGDERLLISNAFTNRLVHKWRSEVAAIAVGTNTVATDNPKLNTRLWPGKNPVRVVVDPNLRLPKTSYVFDETVPTIVFNNYQHSLPFGKIAATDIAGVNYYQVSDDSNLVHQMVNAFYQLGIQCVLVEGGAQLLQSFIDEKLWDEARVITNEGLILGHGLSSPRLHGHLLANQQTIFSDSICTYHRQS